MGQIPHTIYGRLPSLLGNIIQILNLVRRKQTLRNDGSLYHAFTLLIYNAKLYILVEINRYNFIHLFFFTSPHNK